MTVVIDASIAIKWVVPERDADDALLLLRLMENQLIAPDLLVAECANVLWKKAARGELTAQQATYAARLLEQASFEVVPTRNLLSTATDLAIRLNQPAYDCIYLALAIDRRLKLVTVDERLVRKIATESPSLQATVMTLSTAVGAAGRN